MDFSIVIDKLPNLFRGAFITLKYSVISLILGCIIGVCIALMRDYKVSKKVSGVLKATFAAILRSIAWFYIWIIRGTPLMVQLFIIYFGLPQFGITLTPFAAGILGLTLNNGSFIAEIVRSGIHGVDKGEREAARALGMSYHLEMLRIVAPQASKLIMLPMVNHFISTIKNSSILSVITIAELTREGQVMANSSFNYFPVYVSVAVLYLMLTSLCMLSAAYLERRLS